MIGVTLTRYFAWHFARSILLIFLLFFVLIAAVDTIELSRDLGEPIAGRPAPTIGDVALIALTRAGAFAENVLPFAVLFGAASTLLLLNRKLELVVARASGVSVWQFLAPLMGVAALLGLLSATIYNPLAIAGKDLSASLEIAAFGKLGSPFSTRSNSRWQRLSSDQGETILRANAISKNGRDMAGVTAYTYLRDGTPGPRYDAGRALFLDLPGDGENAFRLIEPVRSESGKVAVTLPRFDLPVRLSAAQLQNRITRPEDIGFWDLQTAASNADTSSRNPRPFRTQAAALLSRPLLFVAMVIIAATMSLKFARFGLAWNAIGLGIGAGFMLYVIGRLALTFGSNGLVTPTLAAFLPALVAVMFGVTVLLYQEDG
ncbi:LptF/LptG family permease [Rhizobiaceae bacterium]|nr:LptF/LptG family permease [Rhizobiaceae bacterium]